MLFIVECHSFWQTAMLKHGASHAEAEDVLYIFVSMSQDLWGPTCNISAYVHLFGARGGGSFIRA